jgi:hypothetical protein
VHAENHGNECTVYKTGNQRMREAHGSRMRRGGSPLIIVAHALA